MTAEIKNAYTTREEKEKREERGSSEMAIAEDVAWLLLSNGAAFLSEKKSDSSILQWLR
jgi:hypothetical protein